MKVGDGGGVIKKKRGRGGRTGGQEGGTRSRENRRKKGEVGDGGGEEGGRTGRQEEERGRG